MSDGEFQLRAGAPRILARFNQFFVCGAGKEYQGISVLLIHSGGLIGHGANNVDAWRQGGRYLGRRLKGEKPIDLPVIQATKLELA